VNCNDDDYTKYYLLYYVILLVHSCVVKGNPGNNILERTAFFRNTKYNIGGHVFSLLDVS
jgi:hypothetical protein